MVSKVLLVVDLRQLCLGLIVTESEFAITMMVSDVEAACFSSPFTTATTTVIIILVVDAQIDSPRVELLN